MRAAKLKRKKETRTDRANVPAYKDVVNARDVLLRQAIEARQVRGTPGKTAIRKGLSDVHRQAEGRAEGNSKGAGYTVIAATRPGMHCRFPAALSVPRCPTVIDCKVRP